MKKILCIDGGGMCGYIPAYFLAQLEKRTGKPIAEQFDLMAGTSIGGILTLLLATGQPASECVNFFERYGPKIFPPTDPLVELKGPKYSAKGIEDVLAQVFKDAKLPDCKLPVVVPSLNVVLEAPMIFTSESPHRVAVAARATSAAQTYFPGAYLGDGGSAVLWDGGNIANNPSVVAYASAQERWPGEPVCVLSLGCGAASGCDMSDLVNPLPLHAAIKTVKMNISNGQKLADWIMSRILGDKYTRVQPVCNLPLDDATPQGLQNLQLAAMQSVVDHVLELNQWIKQ